MSTFSGVAVLKVATGVRALTCRPARQRVSLARLCLVPGTRSWIVT